MSIKAISSFKEAFTLILKDKVSLFLALCPVIIGMFLFYFIGAEIFSTLNNIGVEYIEEYLGNGTLGAVINWIVKIILVVLLYYIVNVTFVLVLSIIASPFNDILSQRIEKLVLKEELPSFSESLQGSISNLGATLINEFKKISVIISVTCVSVIVGFIPLLSPVSIFLSAVVLSIEFLDFSWSRHNLLLKDCRGDYRKNLLSYSFGGFFFMILVSIPGVNLIVPSYATSYFTVLWVKSNEHRRQITE